jgi:2-methylcitrate dehydratase PrpD
MSQATTAAVQGVTRTLAQFIVASQPSDIPDPVVHEARRALLHWLGCSLGGCRHEAVESALAAFGDLSGPREATVVGRSERVDILLAALLNGISADVLGFSDTHLKTVIHAGGVIGPAVLALAERTPVSGKDFLHAFLLGIEVALRIGISVYPWHYARGWHITGTAGTFGAAAAAGKLLKLDEQRMTWALGLAATQAAGLREMFGSMAKSLHGGRAAQNGLSAALLAEKGFTGSDCAIEAPRGFANVLGEKPDLAAITSGLGSDFELSQNTYKPFPCGVVIHPVIDGCITLKSSHAIDSASVSRIGLRVNPLVLELCGRQKPATTLEAKLSVYHSAAAATIAGRMTEQEYATAFVLDPAVVALREKIVVTADPAIRDEEADVVIEFGGGKSLHHHVDYATGSTQRPMSDADIETKFRGLAAPVLPAPAIERLIAACWTITRSDDASVLARLAAAPDR